MQSEDDGFNWTDPREITSSVKEEHWTWYATGPCHGIQLQHGSHKDRLLVPCDHILAGSKAYYSHAIYSDDHGLNWKLGCLFEAGKSSPYEGIVFREITW